MTDTTAIQGKPRIPIRRSILAGAVLAALLGTGGFYAVHSGLLFGQGGAGERPAPLPEIAFVPIEALTVSLGPDARMPYLRFSAHIEVARQYQREVELLKPRILDVLNGYLRAVDPAELEQPGTLVRLRAQLLRRIQVVTGDGRVNDLLITEFVLN